ncbi:MAG: hypothetical protein E7047_02275 [Lentisphaerae bacterium]|nr:hypothetical protein [Lentisphaerota bacterium]
MADNDIVVLDGKMGYKTLGSLLLVRMHNVGGGWLSSDYIVVWGDNEWRKTGWHVNMKPCTHGYTQAEFENCTNAVMISLFKPQDVLADIGYKIGSATYSQLYGERFFYLYAEDQEVIESVTKYTLTIVPNGVMSCQTKYDGTYDLANAIVLRDELMLKDVTVGSNYDGNMLKVNAMACNITVNNGGELHAGFETTNEENTLFSIANVTVNNGGTFLGLEGSVAGLTVNNGGVVGLEDTLILRIDSAGEDIPEEYKDMTSTFALDINKGGIVILMGESYISHNVTVGGLLVIDEAMILDEEMQEGYFLDLTLEAYELEAGNSDALLEGFENLALDYTTCNISVKSDMEQGLYKLATDVGSRVLSNVTITVDGSSAGKFTYSDGAYSAVRLNGMDYKLLTDDDCLTLQLSAVPVVPVVPTFADLSIAAFTAPDAVRTTDDVILNFAVRNSGDAAAAASKLYIYVDGVKIGETDIGELAAGATAQGTYTIKGNTLKEGARKIRLVADGSDLVVESNEGNNGYSRTVNVTGTPDLTIAAFTAPASVRRNEAVTLNFTVKNSGDGAAAPSKVYVYDDGVKIGEVAIGSITAGSVCKGTYTIAAGQLAAGTNRIRLLADGAGAVTESNEGNNGNSRSVEVEKPVVVGKPDLIISQFSAASEVKTTDDVTLSFSVKNQGNASAAASKLYIYNDGVKIGEADVKSIAAGATVQGTYTIKGNTLKEGARKIRLVADGDNVIAESNNNNNGYTRTVNVTGTPDLTVAVFSLSSGAIKDNEAVTLNFTVKNSGDGAAAGSLAYIYDNGVKIGEVAIAPVAAGSNVRGSFTIAAGMLAAGEHRLRVVADGANSVVESDNNNNGSSKVLSVAASVTPADLVIGSLSAPEKVDTKQDLTLDYTVRNNGGTAAAVSVLYIYDNGDLLDMVVIDQVAAHSSYAGSYTIKAGELAEGEHRFRLLADATSLVPESDNHNNGYSRSVTVFERTPADLVIAACSAPGSAGINQAVKLDFTVKNNGLTDAGASTLYVYDNGVKIGEVKVDPIAAGAVYKGSYTAAPGVLTVGTHKLRLLADGANSVVESNNNNNGYTRTVEITAVNNPDLTISAFSCAGSVSSNDVLVLNYTVKNVGDMPAASSLLYICNGNEVLGAVVVEPLAAGGVYQGSYKLAADKLKSGSNRVRLLADAAGQITEADENNNGYTRTVNVVENPSGGWLEAGPAAEPEAGYLLPESDCSAAIDLEVAAVEYTGSSSSDLIRLDLLTVADGSQELLCQTAAGMENDELKSKYAIELGICG